MQVKSPDLIGLLKVFQDSNVDFILIGGIAATVHGSSRVTQDVDVVYKRSDENYKKIVYAVGPLNPYLRGAPKGLPFLLDERTLRSGLQFTLDSDLGPIDLLGEVAGGGNYENLINHVDEITLNSKRLLVVNLPKLIELKVAAGRPKDLEAIAELELIRNKLSER